MQKNYKCKECGNIIAANEEDAFLVCTCGKRFKNPIYKVQNNLDINNEKKDASFDIFTDEEYSEIERTYNQKVGEKRFTPTASNDKTDRNEKLNKLWCFFGLLLLIFFSMFIASFFKPTISGGSMYTYRHTDSFGTEQTVFHLRADGTYISYSHYFIKDAPDDYYNARVPSLGIWYITKSEGETYLVLDSSKYKVDSTFKLSRYSGSSYYSSNSIYLTGANGLFIIGLTFSIISVIGILTTTSMMKNNK